MYSSDSEIKYWYDILYVIGVFQHPLKIFLMLIHKFFPRIFLTNYFYIIHYKLLFVIFRNRVYAI